jgi:hypothetical protein
MPSGTLRALSGLAPAVLKPIYQKLDELGGKKPWGFTGNQLWIIGLIWFNRLLMGT